MNNPRLANRYAKSVVGLALEQGQLENLYNDMKLFISLFKSNPDFVNLLKSPVISNDKKLSIIEAVTNGRVSQLTTLFVRLLVNKNREANLPEIAQAVIEQYNEIKQIYKVKLTTASPISKELESSIIEKVKQERNIQNIELETSVDDRLIGGFKLQLGDTLVDGSVLKDLMEIKRQFLNNDYIHQIR